MTRTSDTTSDLPARPLASRDQVATYLGVPPTTLDQWASRGIGPRYRLVGRHARYEWDDVKTWLGAQQAGGAA